MSTPQHSTVPRRPLSGASLGLVPAEGEPQIDLTDHGERYVDGGPLGRGGMGEIRVAFDARLGRRVALKIPTITDLALARQFVAEAKLTARLSHPGIVAIYDAGIRPDGRPYYTMPIIDGRTLADVARATEPAERLRLVRHFLHACEAVAYAHSEGIVHRDLKPANILVGRFGETLVVDWGLAGPIDELPTGVCGTPSYMAPEQARGEAIGAAADVFALGVSLREIVTGAARGGDIAAPPDLMAIVERATREAPDARYGGAAELAEDVAAWFEGRRVTAYRYGVRELAARLWATHRKVLSIVTIAVLAIAVAIVVGALRAAQERALAQASERRAVASRAAAEDALGDALLAHSLAAARDDDWPAAEIFAVDALRHRASPHARGVLAQFDGSARPVRRTVQQLPECDRIVLDERGETLLCTRDGAMHVGSLRGAWRPTATISSSAEPGLLVAGHVVLRESNGAMYSMPIDAPERATLVSPAGGSPGGWHAAGEHLAWFTGTAEVWSHLGDDGAGMTQWCARGGHGAPGAVARRSDGARFVACQDGTIFWMPTTATGTPAPLMSLPSELGAPVRIAFERERGEMVAIALTKGAAVVVDLQQGRIARTIARPSVMPAALALTGDRLAIADDQDRVDVWDTRAGVRVARIAARATHLFLADEGTRLRVFSRQMEDFDLPSTPPRALTQHDDSGVAALALAPDGERLATAHGDGHVRLGDVRSVEASAEIPLHWSVVKDVEFSPDGMYLVAATAQDSALRIIDLRDSMATIAIENVPSARVSWLQDDVIVAAPYGPGLAAWQRGRLLGSYFESLGRFVDMESDGDRRATTALSDGGDIVRLSSTGDAVHLAWRVDAQAVAGSADAIVVLRDHALEVLDSRGSTVREAAVEDGLDLAVDVRDGFVAVSHVDGDVSVFALQDLSRLALLRAHGGRAGSIAFDPRGGWLVTSGWDGAIRQWSLRDTRREPAMIADEIERAWGRTRDDLIGATIVGG